ncbi:MAG TPA: bacterial transcriptional activator domain-containing protein [Anaerolineae bacterium]|nr:bacterial transcriptional activator domain-containing protein [Anaerolineae bacterium]HMR64614.1 bacterial transcriptional activator domain-containing protein [Anaerolineae bacterium]
MTQVDSTTAVLNADVPLRVQTFSGFRVWRHGVEIPISAWKREKALHLFQFLITMREQAARMHKEQIIDYLWPDVDLDTGNQNFKVALHALNKVLEPERKPRSEPQFIQRNDLTYSVNIETIWIDAKVFENQIATGNQLLAEDKNGAIACYQLALDLYQGDYLPERRYDDWSSAERERLQVLALGMMTILANLVLDQNPLESIRLTQRVLNIDPIWEDAYRIQMRAYINQGNRPLAIRTYQQCVKVLSQELGIPPLPETEALLREITTL